MLLLDESSSNIIYVMTSNSRLIICWLYNSCLWLNQRAKIHIAIVYKSGLKIVFCFQKSINYKRLGVSWILVLSNPIFLATAYSPAFICFGRWITCNYPTVLKEKNMEKHKEYNLRYLLPKVRTTWGKASDRLRQRTNKSNKNSVGRLPTLEWNRKITLSDEVRRRIGKG
jgi:hypothetical protein